MKGQILDFSIQGNSGIISGEDGHRYEFQGEEWKETTVPARGMHVDYDISETKAVAVYKAIGAGNAAKSKPAATLWAIFLGGFGAHKFYMGSWGWGIIYLLTFWTYVPFVVALVEWIHYVLMTDEEFYMKAEEFQEKGPGPVDFFW